MMEAGNVASDLFLQSGGGNVSVERVNGQLIVKTGGGQVHIGTAGGTTMETGAGNIEVNKCNGDLRANSGGGNLNLGDVDGTVTGGNRRRKGTAGQRAGRRKGHYRRRHGGVDESGAERARGDRSRSDHRAVRRGRESFQRLVSAYGGGKCSGVPAAQSGSECACLDGAGQRKRHQVGVSRVGHHFGGRAITVPKSMFGEGQLNGGGPILRVRTTIGQIDIRRSQ